MSSRTKKTRFRASGNRLSLSNRDWGNNGLFGLYDETIGREVNDVQSHMDCHHPSSSSQESMTLGLMDPINQNGLDPDQITISNHLDSSEASASDELHISNTDYSESPVSHYIHESHLDHSMAPLQENQSNRHRFDMTSELGPEEVRWFYKEDKKTWKPFVGHDSLQIEIMYRRFCEKTQEERVGDEMHGDLINGGEQEPTEETTENIDIEAVCVRGGLYEVDVRNKECSPVYWNQQDCIPVMRGQWFTEGTWTPVEEDESDLIEKEHLACFQGQQIQDSFEIDTLAKTVDRQDAIHSLQLSHTHVDWYSIDEVYLYSDATTSKIARTVTQKLGFSKASSSGTRLHRGYVEEASLDDKPPQTTHIVFVVHGIGQKMDKDRIIKNTGMLRETVRKMEEKHYAEQTQEHVEFLPVEWRSKLTLDGDTVESITPDKVRGLRDLLNSSAMDIMYYTSPLYRDEITRGLTQELNRLYSLFCSRNPEFEARGGKVSIISHSLGCVITFDIMTGWDPVSFSLREHHEQLQGEDLSWDNHEERHLLEELQITRQRLQEVQAQLDGLKASNISPSPTLKFKVENFFCMGSPLAVFLALRGIRPGNTGLQEHIMPKSICQRLFNIFHPTDPVAYRLEPLVLKHYSNISPVQIHWFNTVNPTPYDEVRPTYLNPSKDVASETENVSSTSTSPVLARGGYYGESITNLGKASIMGAASFGKGIGGILFSRFSHSPTLPSAVDSGVCESEESPNMNALPSISPSTSSSLVLDTQAVEMEHRIDYELREGLVESRYWSAVTSHTAYWSSPDVALFLLTFIYRHESSSQTENTDAS